MWEIRDQCSHGTWVLQSSQENGYAPVPMGSDCYAKFWKVNKVPLFMFSMKMVNGKTGKYLSYIQWNLSTMATMGTEESGHYNEVHGHCREVKKESITGLFVRRWLVTAFHFFIKSPEEGLLVPPKYCRPLIAKFTLLGILVWKDTVFKKLKIVYPVLSRPYRGILTCPPPGGEDRRREARIGIHTTLCNWLTSYWDLQHLK